MASSSSHPATSRRAASAQPAKPRGIQVAMAPDRPENRYAQIGHENLCNVAKLSAVAVAVHHYLITRPEGWVVGGADDVAEFVFPNDSRDSIRQAFRELRNAGYLVLRRRHAVPGDLDREGNPAKLGTWVSWYEPFHEQRPEAERTPSSGKLRPTKSQRQETRARTELGKLKFPQVRPDARSPAAGNSAA